MSRYTMLLILVLTLLQGTEAGARAMFAGQPVLADRGTYLSETRIYDALQGAFLSPDPLFIRQPERCMASFQNCNLYTYAENAPVHKLDPSGLVPRIVSKKAGIRRLLMNGASRRSRFTPNKQNLLRARQETALLHMMMTINPHRGNMNCGNCAVALDRTLGGKPTFAQLDHARPLEAMEKLYGKNFSKSGSAGEIRAHMQGQRTGTRFIVAGERHGGIGHFFNAIVLGNASSPRVYFLDGQIGQPASLAGYDSFRILRTF